MAKSIRSTLFSIGLLLLIPSISLGQTPTWDWATGWGDSWGGVHELAVDPSGNSYVIGEYYQGYQIIYGDTVYGGISSTIDSYIAKFDNQGAYQWVYDIPNSGSHYWNCDVAVDNENNAVACFTASAYTQGGDILKFDPLGNLISQVHLANALPDLNSSIAIDSMNNVFVTADTVNGQMRLYKFDNNLNYLWSFGTDQYVQTNAPSPLAISAKDDYVILFGRANGGATFQGFNVSAGLFMMKCDANGDIQWVQGFTGVGNILSLGIDENHNIYGAGVAYSQFSFNGTNYGNPSADIWLTKFSPTGQVIWSQLAGTGGSDYLGDLKVNGNGVFITGDLFGNLLHSGVAEFDTIQQTAYGASFVASYDFDGNAKWLKIQPSPNLGSTQLYSIDLDQNGNVYVGGESPTPSIFDSLNLDNNTIFAFDGYPNVSVLAKLVPQCNANPISFEFSQSFGGASCDGSISVLGLGGTEPYNYQWDENGGNQSTATIENLCPDEYCVTISDGNSCSIDTCFTISIAVGLKDESELKGIKIAPNPTNDVLGVSMKQRIPNLTYRIMDSMGRIEKQGVITEKKMVINVENLSASFHVIQFISDNRLQSMKFSVTK